jgi:hypothetical protein
MTCGVLAVTVGILRSEAPVNREQILGFVLSVVFQPDERRPILAILHDGDGRIIRNRIPKLNPIKRISGVLVCFQ